MDRLPLVAPAAPPRLFIISSCHNSIGLVHYRRFSPIRFEDLCLAPSSSPLPGAGAQLTGLARNRVRPAAAALPAEKGRRRRREKKRERKSLRKNPLGEMPIKTPMRMFSKLRAHCKCFSRFFLQTDILFLLSKLHRTLIYMYTRQDSTCHNRNIKSVFVCVCVCGCVFVNGDDYIRG